MLMTAFNLIIAFFDWYLKEYLINERDEVERASLKKADTYYVEYTLRI